MHGLQCSRLVAEYDLIHLSAGDLLRAHMKSGTKDGQMVADMIKNGQIVPSYVSHSYPVYTQRSYDVRTIKIGITMLSCASLADFGFNVRCSM